MPLQKSPRTSRISGSTSSVDGSDAPRRPLLFLHVDKTAGTSLLRMLRDRFPQNEWLLQAQHPQFDSEDLNRFPFVEAHGGFELLRRFETPPVVMTMLRHPIDRTISAYYYARGFTRQEIVDHFPRAEPGVIERRLKYQDVITKLSLPEALRADPLGFQEYFGNTQTQQLGRGGSTEPSEMLAAACENLRRCDVVGLTERFADSAELLARHFGWASFDDVPRENVTSHRLRAADLDVETRQRLVEMLADDMRLYRFAESSFDERWRTSEARFAGRPRPLRMDSLPDATDYRFERPLVGAGWHEREWDGLSWVRWTSDLANSWADFRPLAGSDATLRCELRRIAISDASHSVQVSVNGHPIPTSLRRNKYLVGRVPQAALEANRERLRIGFHVPQRWRPCDLNAASTDVRRLGIGVRRIQLEPATSFAVRWAPWRGFSRAGRADAAVASFPSQSRLDRSHDRAGRS